MPFDEPTDDRSQPPRAPGTQPPAAPGQVPTQVRPLEAADPRSFGTLRLIGRLGEGGMGQAFLAESAGGWVVVKAALGGPDVEQVRARMRREAETMRLINSPVVARIVEGDLDAELPWLAFEFLPGLTLAQRIGMFGPLPTDALIDVGTDLARCLAVVHSGGVVHRDLKPSNVILTTAGARLIDFGAAEHRDATDLTTVGQLIGTLRWMAPEQFASGAVGPATDIHAWGLLMIFAATAAAPVQSDTAASTIRAVLHDEPVVPRAAMGGPLADLVGRAVAKDPVRRPTAVELVAGLEHITFGDPAGATIVGSGSAPHGSALDPPGQVPQAFVPPGGVAHGQVPPGQVPPGQVAPGNVPPGHVAPAQVPQGQALPGHVPPGHIPPGHIPPGYAPPGYAPPGYAPPGRPAAPVPATRSRGRTRAWAAVAVVACLLAAAAVAVGTGVLGSSDVGGDDSALPVPVAAPAGARLVRLSVGESSACALDDSGRVLCWGSNDHGQLGSPGGDAASPRQVADAQGSTGGSAFTRVAVGARHACAIDGQGRAYCWGSNDAGQLGTGDTRDHDRPVPVQAEGVLAGKRLVLIGASPEHTCALDDRGSLFCWGSNADGQFGNGSTADSLRPVAVDVSGALAGRRLDWFAMGDRHTCAMDTTGNTYCWGANDRGQLGDGSTRQSLVPVPVLAPQGLGDFRTSRVSAAGATSCAWDGLGRVVCWGAGDSGQRGDGTTVDATRPIPASFGSPAPKIVRFSSGARSTCASDDVGRAFCWGANEHGQLGDGSVEQSATPVPLALPAPPEGPAVIRVSVGDGTSCGLLADGSAICWGSDEAGRLGRGEAE